MISVVIPAYNEEESIPLLIEALEEKVKLEEPYELLIVNDGSADKTQQIVEGLMNKYDNIRLVNHEKNQGLGVALRTGFKYAAGRIIVTTDADLTHPPELIRELVKNCDDVDVCIASRYVKGGGMKNVPLWRVLISKVINKVFQLLFFTKIRDVSAGFKAYKSDKINSIRLTQDNFEIQLEIIMNLVKKGCTFKEIPYTLVNRRIGVSKFNFFKAAPQYFLNSLKIAFHRWF